MTDTAQPLKRPLEEVMLAMDVVDTLRHRESLVSRELNEDERDRQLIARLRESFPELPENPDPKTVFLKLRELRNSW